MSVSATNVVAWNGPICQTCGARYLGTHECTWDDLQARINELRTAQDRLSRPRVMTPQFETVRPFDNERDTSRCPCRPENGGSGVCGCILSGPQVSC